VRRFGAVLIDHYRKPRVLGLDLLRILAASSIVIFHGNPTRALGGNLFSFILARDGNLAVDIFFVLSGWLLTRQALRMRGAFRSGIGFATRFWTRRWARTLPPYWVMLVIILLAQGWLARDNFPYPITIPAIITHAVFLQSVFPPNVYGVSWSLVAEEWFYLLLPLVVLAMFKLRSWRIVMAVGIAVLFIPLAVRVITLELPIARDGGLTVVPHARFDGLVVGALLGGASIGAPWWVHVMRYRRPLFTLGVSAIVPLLIMGTTMSRLYFTLGLLAFNLALGLTLPFLSQLHWPKATPLVAVVAVTYLSELTYPIYLVHRVVQIHWLYEPAVSLRIAHAILAATVVLLAASALHLGVERPFLWLRDRNDLARKQWKESAVADRLASPSPLAGEGRVGGNLPPPLRGRVAGLSPSPVAGEGRSGG
jgi:peptidoglycan/LPS O-acetylase OafA/YrhL